MNNHKVVKILGFTAAAFGVYKLTQFAINANNLYIMLDERINKLKNYINITYLMELTNHYRRNTKNCLCTYPLKTG